MKQKLSSDQRAQIRKVKISTLRTVMGKLLIASGSPEDAAFKCADVFLDADLKGIGLQGLDHIFTLVRHLQTGRTDPSAVPEIMKETAATALIDGHRGFGQIAALFAVDVAVRKARAAGSVTVGVVNSGDFFMAGHYAERIARAGLVGFAFSDAPPLVHAAGGTERMTGTNPLAIGFPSAGQDPIVHDMSTSALSASRIRQAAYFGEDVPPGMGVCKDGEPTQRADEIRDGAIAPLAGHKGFGLALSVALLSGPLVGALCGPALNDWMTNTPGKGGARGQLFIAIDPEAFGDAVSFREKVSAYTNQIRSSRKATGVDAIRMPGERSFATRRRQQAVGEVAIYETVWQKAVDLAKSVGVIVPEE